MKRKNNKTSKDICSKITAANVYFTICICVFIYALASPILSVVLEHCGVLTLLDKRGNEVSAVIYTQQISRQFQLDIDRHNAQYAPIDVETFRLSHDRFLCIDDDVYHIGASIKDLGKKWFGFSKMEILTPDELVERINRE